MIFFWVVIATLLFLSNSSWAVTVQKAEETKLTQFRMNFLYAKLNLVMIRDLVEHGKDVVKDQHGEKVGGQGKQVFEIKMINPIHLLKETQEMYFKISDVNDDDKVDIFDLVLVASHYGEEVELDNPYDIGRYNVAKSKYTYVPDRQIDIADLILVINYFGEEMVNGVIKHEPPNP